MRGSLLAGAIVAALSAGCAAVKPWQRETLADPIMQSDRNPAASAMLDHIYDSREAATGGRTVGGGGAGATDVLLARCRQLSPGEASLVLLTGVGDRRIIAPRSAGSLES